MSYAALSCVIAGEQRPTDDSISRHTYLCAISSRTLCCENVIFIFTCRGIYIVGIHYQETISFM